MKSLTAGVLSSTASPPFTLKQLECFVAVAECGSISKAAALVRASDSAVSDSITAMEKGLGATLFHRRRSKGATLTSDGLAILPLAHRMLNDAEELASAVGRDAGTLIGPIRVGAVDTLAPVVLPRLIELMSHRHPGVRVLFRTGDQPTLVAALESAELDLLITFDIDVAPELRRRAISSTQAGLVFHTGHPFATRDAVSLEEVAEEPMVLLDIYSSRVHTLELMSNRSITPRIAFRTDSYELCRSLVGRGLGYSLLMRRSINAQTWDGRDISWVPITPAPRRVDILATWVNGAHPPRLAALIDAAAAIGSEVNMK